jgi:gliding motility-associated lipoprotein GldH
MRISGFFAFIILLMACESDRLYEKNYEFSNRIWHIDSIPEFQFEISSDTQEYNILLNIRNTLSYPYQNIYIQYYLEDTLGQDLESDLINHQLFNAKTGDPLGDGGVGDIYDHRFRLLENYRFPGEGTYRIKLQQYMRRDSLPEIIAVGIRVDKSTIN